MRPFRFFCLTAFLALAAAVSAFIAPGKSASFTLNTSLSGEKEIEIARKLESGGYKASGSSLYLLAGKGNLHVDASGGGLKPAR